ncbi:MAG: Sec-independent protein translocase protein TatB [Shimia sp.]
MGWMELLIVGVVALIVVGPKDLPVMFQALGKMTAKVKRMAREFSSAMNEAADASGASDIGKELKGLSNPRNFGMDALKDAADSFDKWEPGQSQRAMGPETAKLAKERAEAARRAREAMDRRAQERRDAEAAAREEAEDVADMGDAEAPPAAEVDAGAARRMPAPAEAAATPKRAPKKAPAEGTKAASEAATDATAAKAPGDTRAS